MACAHLAAHVERVVIVVISKLKRCELGIGICLRCIPTVTWLLRILAPCKNDTSVVAKASLLRLRIIVPSRLLGRRVCSGVHWRHNIPISFPVRVGVFSEALRNVLARDRTNRWRAIGQGSWETQSGLDYETAMMASGLSNILSVRQLWRPLSTFHL